MTAEEPSLWAPLSAKIGIASGTADAAALQDAENLLLPQPLSGVFDEAFDIYKRNFVTLASIVAIIFLPLQTLLYALANLWLRPLAAHVSDNDTLGWTALIFGRMFVGGPEYALPGVLTILTLIVVSAPLTVALSDIYVGKPPLLRDCYRRAIPRVPRLILAWVLGLFAFFALSSVAAIVYLMVLGTLATVYTFSHGPAPEIVIGIVTYLGMPLPYILGMSIIAYSFSFTTPLIVLENASVGAVPTRNAQLVGRKRFLRCWAACTFLPVLVLGLQAIILVSSASALGALHLPPLLNFMLETSLSAVLVFFLMPYMMIFLTALYYDYRVRREGFDVRVLSADMPLPPMFGAEQPPAPLPSTNNAGSASEASFPPSPSAVFGQSTSAIPYNTSAGSAGAQASRPSYSLPAPTPAPPAASPVWNVPPAPSLAQTPADVSGPDEMDGR